MNKNFCKGFTLLEIILTVAILGVIAGLAVPSLNKAHAKFQLNQTVDHLAYLMRYAQSRAILKHQDHQLVIRDTEKKYWLVERKVEKKGFVEEDFKRLSGRLGKTFKAPKEISFKTDESKLDFAANGKMGKINVQLCLKEYCLMVSTKEINGYVSVYELES